MDNSQALLRLLQLASPALPVGAFSYSEGLETLVETGVIETASSLHHWLNQELHYGVVRLEAVVVVRVYRAMERLDWPALAAWNQWLSAVRETAEGRSQSWQMGRSLIRMVEQMEPELKTAIAAVGTPCNFAVAFGMTASYWDIDPSAAVLGYLQSWATNLVNAGVKLIPLGQTTGQQLLLQLYPEMAAIAPTLLTLPDTELTTSGWGASLASMQHETLYSRLFRS